MCVCAGISFFMGGKRERLSVCMFEEGECPSLRYGCGETILGFGIADKDGEIRGTGCIYTAMKKEAAG